MVFLRGLDHKVPDIIVKIVFCLLVGQVEMLHVQLLPELVGELNHLPFLLPSLYCDHLRVLNDHSQLSIPGSLHRAVVDIGRTNERDPVVNYHDFAVNVDDFGDWFVFDFAAGPETEDEEILFDVGLAVECVLE